MTFSFEPPAVPTKSETRRQEVDGMRILQTLAERWRGAQTLQYRSQAVMRHAGEFRVQIDIAAQLRRPRCARLLFDADRPDVSRLRVCDGRAIFDRTRGTVLRPAQSLREGFMLGGKVTQNIPHPLDEASYCADQFFSPTPFWPPKTWGDGTGRVKVAAEKVDENQRSFFRITLESGTSRDTLTLDAQNYAPLKIVRVAEHAGMVQELLNETFTDVRLGVFLPAELFVWTPRRDEARSATFLSSGMGTASP